MVETVRAWVGGLEGLHDRIAHRFARTGPRWRALAYPKGLVSVPERKNGWCLAKAMVEATPDGEERRRELARMLSGRIDEASLAHARELLTSDY